MEHLEQTGELAAHLESQRLAREQYATTASERHAAALERARLQERAADNQAKSNAWLAGADMEMPTHAAHQDYLGPTGKPSKYSPQEYYEMRRAQESIRADPANASKLYSPGDPTGLTMGQVANGIFESFVKKGAQLTGEQLALKAAMRVFGNAPGPAQRAARRGDL